MFPTAAHDGIRFFAHEAAQTSLAIDEDVTKFWETRSDLGDLKDRSQQPCWVWLSENTSLQRIEEIVTFIYFYLSAELGKEGKKIKLFLNTERAVIQLIHIKMWKNGTNEQWQEEQAGSAGPL